MAPSPALTLPHSPLFDPLHSFSRLQLLRRSSASKIVQLRPKSFYSRTPHPALPSSCRRIKRGGCPLTSEDLSSGTSWLKGWEGLRFRRLPCRQPAALNYRAEFSSDEDEAGASRSTGGSTMEKIIDKLKRFGYIDDSGDRKPAPLPERGTVEDIFYSEDGILPDSRGGLSLNLEDEVRFPWENPSGASLDRRKRSRTSLAELTLPEAELRRLRHMAIRMKSKTKIGGAGVTKEVVGLIHEKWKTDEVVRIKCEGAPALNMKRMHEILERKTGGLVIWRSGTSLSLYRGVTYEVSQPVKRQHKIPNSSFAAPAKHHGLGEDPRDNLMTPIEKEEKEKELPPETEYEHEIDKLLADLGPRYSDWPGSDPLPIDADLLPGIVPGYKPPFRVLPYGVKPSLGRKEATALRRLARALPPHFALGRSRQLHGLATAMVKLWEKSSIAKIALKRGVQLTTSERMAEDIKKLTGATILSRNKDFVVFYRGKDFLSSEVTEVLLERERLAKALQDEEEQARLRAVSLVTPSLAISRSATVEDSGMTGTLGETLEADSRWGSRLDNDHVNSMTRAVEMARHTDLVRKLERKLRLAEKKIMKAERALAKVEESLKPTEPTKEPETVTDEERFMFRKLGLRMKAFLLLGRRGVFDGTVENMHLHWKYRELVKVLVKAKTFSQVKNIALSLEAESGGVLVSVDKISKGFAIIVYRGKDYQRPPTIRPKNLLTKRKALARSIELQRHEAINRFITNLNRRVEQLKSELVQMENVKDSGDEELYKKLDSAYSTEEEDAEVEEEDAYCETFDGDLNNDSDEDRGAESYLDGDDDDDDDGDFNEEDEEEEDDYDNFENNGDSTTGFVDNEDERADYVHTSRSSFVDLHQHSVLGNC